MCCHLHLFSTHCHSVNMVENAILSRIWSIPQAMLIHTVFYDISVKLWHESEDGLGKLKINWYCYTFEFVTKATETEVGL